MRQAFVNLMPGFFVRLFAKPYVSGDSIEKGITKTNDLWLKDKIKSTLDLLGEEVFTKEAVEINILTYIELIEMLKEYDHATVSIKPSALGSHESYDYCEQSMRKIISVGKENEVKITIDMEDHTLTDLTLKLYRNLLKEFPDLGIVLQSRLFRTFDDIKSFDVNKIRVRICIGIYNESSDIAITKKPEMKDKLVEMAEYMIEKGHFVECATHDLHYLQKMLDLADQKGWTNEQLEFQQLMGVPIRKMQKKIIKRGYDVRLYVPFATHWDMATPYLKRRIINNPKMILYVLKNLFTRN